MKLNFPRSFSEAFSRHAANKQKGEAPAPPVKTAVDVKSEREDDYRYGRDYELYYWMPAPGAWYH
ncbi:hypothetical protein [Rhizobium rhizogenes]|uniref:hypothetical protein n=1 Tax=Rhizobium rhizogenes TaxID=359 RepID=UPI001571D2F8|nr:hypothetical protein [Rhizobium rhizogenes]NTI78685.1 hypothetical protein [Rhizobium rhizogenes]